MPIHLLQIAKKLAHDAGKMAIEYQKKGFKVGNKGRSNDPVTEADKACNALIIDTIKKNFPDHTVISEESEIMHGSSDYKWIIDPIDGTNNFVHKLPLFSVSIAVVKKGKPIIGVVDIPGLGESYWAQEGKGAYLGERPIHVSMVNEMQDALFATGFPYDRDTARAKKAMELFEAFQKPAHGIRRMGSAAMDLCFLASGRIDGFWEYGLKSWDIAAGKIIVEEAGGMVTNMDGSKLDPRKEMILASNGSLHSKMLKVIEQKGGANV